MRMITTGALCMGLALATSPVRAQPTDSAPPGIAATPTPAEMLAAPAPVPQTPAASPDEISHQAMVEEQERRDREEQAERDRDDQA